jgi:ribosome-binding ATPase
MNIGLAGLPMSGKTTIFNMATRANAQIRDYLAQTDEVNSGVIKVPDPRLDFLTGIFKPKRTVPATVEFTDIPGVSKDETGFSSKTLAHIRICDALMLVIRIFTGDEIPHIHNRVDPAADIEELCLEFLFADLELVQNKLQRLEKEMKGTKKPEQIREHELFTRLKAALEENRPISSLNLPPEEENLVRGYRFLTLKPILVVGNGSDDQIKNPDQDERVRAFRDVCNGRGWPFLLVSGKTEMEIASLSPEEEAAFLQEYGITQSSRDRLIAEAYRVLNYISFLTVGEDEVRAWPIQRGLVAQKAAGKIHSDIERGFIRAEVVAYDDFVAKGSMNAVKQSGLARLEGKEYPVKDGDIINFRFNV